MRQKGQQPQANESKPPVHAPAATTAPAAEANKPPAPCSNLIVTPAQARAIGKQLCRLASQLIEAVRAASILTPETRRALEAFARAVCDIGKALQQTLHAQSPVSRRAFVFDNTLVAMLLQNALTEGSIANVLTRISLTWAPLVGPYVPCSTLTPLPRCPCAGTPKPERGEAALCAATFRLFAASLDVIGALLSALVGGLRTLRNFPRPVADAVAFVAAVLRQLSAALRAAKRCCSLPYVLNTLIVELRLTLSSASRYLSPYLAPRNSQRLLAQDLSSALQNFIAVSVTLTSQALPLLTCNARQPCDRACPTLIRALNALFGQLPRLERLVARFPASSDTSPPPVLRAFVATPNPLGNPLTLKIINISEAAVHQESAFAIFFEAQLQPDQRVKVVSFGPAPKFKFRAANALLVVRSSGDNCVTPRRESRPSGVFVVTDAECSFRPDDFGGEPGLEIHNRNNHAVPVLFNAEVSIESDVPANQIQTHCIFQEVSSVFPRVVDASTEVNRGPLFCSLLRQTGTCFELTVAQVDQTTKCTLVLAPTCPTGCR